MFDQHSNGFLEKAILFATAAGSLMFAEAYPTHQLLTLWYSILAGVTLYLAWHFDIFSFKPADWAQSEATGWSQNTLGQVPSEYVQYASDLRERFVPRHGVFWWFFRAVYLLLGFMLSAVVIERLILGTNDTAQVLLRVVMTVI